MFWKGSASLQDEKKYDGSGPSQNFLHFKAHVLGSDSATFLSLVNVADKKAKILKSMQMELFHWPYLGYKYSSKTRNLNFLQVE